MNVNDRRLRVLVADDSPVVRERLAALLCDIPAADLIGVADTAPEALRLVRELRPDVLTLDWQMPGGTGADVLAALRQSTSGPMVMVLTNYADDAFREKAMALGAAAFLDKTREFDRIPELLDAMYAARMTAHRPSPDDRMTRQVLDAVLELIPQRVFWKDRDSRIIGCNAAFARDAGFASPGELAGRQDQELIWRDSAPLYRNDDLRVMTAGESLRNYEEEQRCADGTVRCLRTSKVPLRDEEGGICGVVGVYEDITARRRAAESEVRLITAIEQAFDSVVITDDKAIIKYVNPAFERATGYTSAEALGRNPSILKSGRQDEAFYRDMWKTLSSGRVWHGHMVNKRKDGSLYEEDATISPIHDAAGRIINYVAVKRDVTAEMALSRQVQRTQKLESMGHLAGGVAHDFNNIMQAILGLTEILLDDPSLAGNHRQDLEEIKGIGRRATDLTRQLLAFSRRQPLAPTILNLGELLDGAQMMLRRLIGANICFVTEWAEVLPPVKADASQIEQVLLNLVVNARDAMPDGGRLTLSTSTISLGPDNCAAMPESYPGEFVCFAVSDTGVGMGKETLAHLFEPFFSTKEPGKGTGLGLSVVYGIVHQHKGWLHVSSEPGKGSTFTVYLPACPDSVDAVHRPVEATSVMPPPGGGRRILVIEDAPDVRNLTARILSASGYDVRAAGTVAEGLELFDRERGRFDGLLADVVLPDRSGLEAAEILRNRRGDLPVLLCSGYSDARMTPADMERRRYQFLQKPFSPAKLLQVLHETLAATPCAGHETAPA